MARFCNWLLSMLVGMAFVCVVAFAGDAPEKFSPEAWRATAHSHADNWSREALLNTFAASNQISGMGRDQVIALLGQPGYEAESFGIGTDLLTRFDVYRLSAKNNRSYKIEYDANRKIISHALDDHGCVCDACSGEAPLALATNLAMRLKADVARRTASIKIAELEALIGAAGKRSFRTATVGGQQWINYTDVWRMNGAQHKFLIVEGAHIARDWSIDALGEETVNSYSVITMMPNCLAP